MLLAALILLLGVDLLMVAFERQRVAAQDALLTRRCPYCWSKCEPGETCAECFERTAW